MDALPALRELINSTEVLCDEGIAGVIVAAVLEALCGDQRPDTESYRCRTTDEHQNCLTSLFEFRRRWEAESDRRITYAALARIHVDELLLAQHEADRHLTLVGCDGIQGSAQRRGLLQHAGLGAPLLQPAILTDAEDGGCPQHGNPGAGCGVCRDALEQR